MLLTRLPLPLRGVRLACVRPAASVRSEPGSNSQVESLDSGFGLEVNPRNHLRNGHLHNMIFTSVARSKYHGDGIETQMFSRVCLTSVLRPKSARTPPSAFPFLQIQLSKSKLENTNSTSGEPPGFSETTEARPVTRLKASEFREFDALQGRRSSDAHQRAPFKQHHGSGVNTRFKKTSYFLTEEENRAISKRYKTPAAAFNVRFSTPVRLCASALIAPRLFHNLAKRLFAPFLRGRTDANSRMNSHGCGIWLPGQPKRDVWRPHAGDPRETLTSLAGLWGTAAGASAS